jgi:hypothetical protein
MMPLVVVMLAKEKIAQDDQLRRKRRQTMKKTMMKTVTTRTMAAEMRKKETLINNLKHQMRRHIAPKAKETTTIQNWSLAVSPWQQTLPPIQHPHIFKKVSRVPNYHYQ